MVDKTEAIVVAATPIARDLRKYPNLKQLSGIGAG